MPIDHFGLKVPASKFEDMINFLTGALKHMGFKEHWRPVPLAAGLGETTPYLWLDGTNRAGIDEDVLLKLAKTEHFAFIAESNEQVDQFHAAALQLGAKDNGAPGLRPQYHEGYYGAFVLDPVVGSNIEVVCRNGKGYQG